MNKKINALLKYLIPPLLVIFLMLVIYYIKGTIPFGNNNIIEADMGQGYVSIYYYMREILFGGKSILWTFNFASGSIMEWIMASNALLSPLNIILAFVKENAMINFIPIFLIIKLSMMSLTASIFFKKTFKNLSMFYVTILSLLFTFSGYIFLSYHNIIWFDSLIYLPLLALATIHLFKTGKVIPFIVMLAVELITSFYISYMICLALITCGTIYICNYVNKSERKKIMMKSLLGVLSALLISLPFILPVLLQTPNTYRYQYFGGGSTSNDIMTKINFYLCSSFLIVIPIMLIIKKIKKKEYSEIKYWILTLIPLLFGLFIEKINLIWHGGSYVMFPYRYGFIPLFILLCMTAKYFNENCKSTKIKRQILEITKIFAFIGMVATILLIAFKNVPLLLEYDLSIGIKSKEVLNTIFLIFIPFVVSLSAIMIFKNNLLKKVMIIILLFIEIIVNGVIYFGRDQLVINNYDYKTDLLLNAEKYTEVFNIKDDNKLNRYRDTTATMNENYSFALNVPTICGWSIYSPYSQFAQHQNWGYSTRYTRLQDVGGTLFSDAFYHIKYLFSYDELNANIYTKKSEYHGVKLYEKDTLPLGIIHNNYPISNNPENSFDFQNDIYQRLFEKSDEIIQKITPEFDQINDYQFYSSINLKKQSNLYLMINGTSYINQIAINGKTIKVPYVGNSLNTYYPNGNYNGILDLGSYVGKVTINISSYSNEFINDATFGYIEQDKYLKLLNDYNYDTKSIIKGNTLSLSVSTSESKKYLLLPISYFKGVEATVNGKKVTVEAYLDNYVNIPLQKGNNYIKITFYPNNFKLYTLISILTISATIILCYLNKKYKLEDKSILQKIGSIIFIIAASVTFVYIYLYSLIK